MDFTKYDCAINNAGDVLCVGDTVIYPAYVALVACFDGQGSRRWSKAYHFHDTGEALDITATADGGCVVAGRWLLDSLFSHPYGVYVLKLDEAGDTLWTRYFTRGSTSCQVDGVQIRALSDGGYLIAEGGACDITPPPHGYYLLRLNSLGDSLWSRDYPVPSSTLSDYAEFRDLQIGQNGEACLVGQAYITNGWADTGWLVCVDSLGDVVWQGTYPGIRFQRAVSDADGWLLSASILDVPTNDYHAWAVRIGSDSAITWSADGGRATFAGRTGSFAPTEIVPSLNGVCTLVATADLYTGTPMWSLTTLLNLAAPLAASPAEARAKDSPAIHFENAEPNPFNSTTHLTYVVARTGHVSLRVHSILGRTVADLVNETQMPGTYRIEWTPTSLPSGVYFARLSTPESATTQKLLLLK